MKKTLKLLICLTLILTFVMALASCSPDFEGIEVHVATLNGTTGFGMAQLIGQDKNGKTEIDYSFYVRDDASLIMTGLTTEAYDIAALPTNAAANLYQKTNGGIKILAVNTLGVLYVVSNTRDSGITSLSDLEGKTVYCPAQNPMFIFKGLCAKAGVNVKIDTTYAEPAALRDAFASGKVELAVLPEPMVTVVSTKKPATTVVIDLTQEWKQQFGNDSLMQGCVVARTEFIEEHPDAVKKFLEEYKASVEFAISDPTTAGRMIVAAKIFENDVIAAAALPKCNIKYIDGDEMARGLNTFFETLYSINPQAVGGSVPDADIYYKG